MKINVDKILHYWRSKLKNHKYWESQFNLNFNCYLEIELDLKLTSSFQERHLRINILGLLEFNLNHELECDHEGWRFTINVFGLEYLLNYIDCRHWDYDNDTYEQPNDKKTKVI